MNRLQFDVEFELNREHIYYCWRQYMNRYKIATKKTDTYKWIIERSTKWNHTNQIETVRRGIKIYVHDKTYMTMSLSAFLLLPMYTININWQSPSSAVIGIQSNFEWKICQR